MVGSFEEHGWIMLRSLSYWPRKANNVSVVFVKKIGMPFLVSGQLLGDVGG